MRSGMALKFLIHNLDRQLRHPRVTWVLSSDHRLNFVADRSRASHRA